jgi:hypothetical protein
VPVDEKNNLFGNAALQTAAIAKVTKLPNNSLPLSSNNNQFKVLGEERKDLNKSGVSFE